MVELRIIESDEVSELVRKVEFLSYLSKARSNNNMSEVVEAYRKFEEEVEFYNTAVSMWREEQEEFAGIYENKDWSKSDYSEHINWGNRLRDWRLKFLIKTRPDLDFMLLRYLPRGDKFEKDYLLLYKDIVIGKNSQYLLQEAGVDPIPISGMCLVKVNGIKRAKREFEDMEF